ncbi:MAG: molybdenum ABC transporter ATP-binding protein [Pseudomonadota bacterium]
MSLEVRLHSRLGEFEIDASFSAGSGVTAIFGQSGSGKTSILKMIAGLMQPQSGSIKTDDTALFDSAENINLAVHRRRIGMVFQDARLFPHMSVARNLTYGRWAGKRTGSADLSRITGLLGIEGLSERYPATLSGGEKQRVAIGRALLSEPALLLMDEPLASLDQERKREIIPYLEEVRDRMGLPIIYVSHDIDEVARLADTLVLLSDGKVLGSGDAVDMFSKLDFGPELGRYEAGALMSGTVHAFDPQYGLCTIALDGGQALHVVSQNIARGERLRVRIKARDVALSVRAPEGVSIRNVLEGTVRGFAVDDSPFVEILVDVAGQILRARITRQAFDSLGIREGLPVFAMIKSVAIGRRMVSARR